MQSSKIGSQEFVYPNRKEFLQLKKEIFTGQCYSPSRRSFDHIVDVGAYIGLSTAFFAMNYPDAKIHAYEPNPEIQEYLIKNTERFQNVDISNSAVTRKGGTIKFYLSTPDEQWFSNSSLSQSSWNGHVRSRMVVVQSVPLQNTLDKLTGEVLLKIDVEGYETVLLGDHLHLSGVSELFIEYHPQQTNQLKKLTKYLRKEGFDLSYLKEGSVSVEPPPDGLFLIHGVR